MRRRNNFSSTDCTVGLVVIGVLLALGSVACQSYTTGLQKSQARGDEASVIATMRTITVAQQAYAVTNEGSYATFPKLSEGGYLDERFASDTPEMHGYVLTMTVGDKMYSCNADPNREGDLKGRHFYVDATSPLIKVNEKQPATASDELLKF